LSNRGVEISGFVHDYYFVAKFKAAYEGKVTTMPDRSQWPIVALGFKVWPPLQKKAAGRPEVQRIRGTLEKGPKRKVRCGRCKGYGHFAKSCKLVEPAEDVAETPSKRYGIHDKLLEYFITL
jgi:hypothetical protein